MQFVRFGMILVAAFIVVSSNGFAQESDYNDALKAQIKTRGCSGNSSQKSCT